MGKVTKMLHRIKDKNRDTKTYDQVESSKYGTVTADKVNYGKYNVYMSAESFSKPFGILNKNRHVFNHQGDNDR